MFSKYQYQSFRNLLVIYRFIRVRFLSNYYKRHDNRQVYIYRTFNYRIRSRRIRTFYIIRKTCIPEILLIVKENHQTLPLRSLRIQNGNNNNNKNLNNKNNEFIRHSSSKFINRSYAILYPLPKQQKQPTHSPKLYIFMFSVNVLDSLFIHFNTYSYKIINNVNTIRRYLQCFLLTLFTFKN